MIKVKLFNMHWTRSNNPMDSKSFEDDKSRMEGFNSYFIPNKDYIYKDLQLTLDEDYDYAVILDQVFKSNYFDPKKSILIRLEPEILRRGFNEYLEKVKPEEFMKVYDIYTLWSIPYDYMDSNKYEKTKMFSSIISGNTGTEMHRKRLQFVYEIDKHFDFYDHFGRGDFSNLRSHRGAIQNRFDGLQTYKYHFNAENSREPSGFSEKILDPILCECLTFYDGASELEKYINPDAFIRINLDDPERSIHTIKTAIENNEWEKRLDIIRKTKWEIYHELNPLELAWKAIHQIKNKWE